MEKEEFIKKVAKKILENKCDLFIGSGISSASGMPSWKNLLEDLAKEIKLEINDEDDLKLIAQYIINANSGNNNKIRNKLKECIKNDFPINDNHRAIQNLNIKTIWTTNYDNLLEKTFEGKRICNIISSDSELSSPKFENDLNIIKLHGCINRDMKNIIITQEDYDKFIFEKEAMAQKLRDTLLNKSILFLGYGYRDPDIRNIMIEAMKQANNHTEEHFMIITFDKKVGKGNLQKELRFDLWTKELQRLGIETLVVDTYKAVTETLKEISLASKGNSIFITGSHDKVSSKKDFFKELGEKIVSIDKVILINGQSEGVGTAVLTSFMTKLVQDKKEIGKHLKFFPNPYAANKKYSNDDKLIPQLKKERQPLLATVRIAIFFSGGMGTKAELEIAEENNCIIIPGILEEKDYNNEVIKRIIENRDILETIKKVDKDYYKLIIDKKKISVDDLIGIIKKGIGNA